MLLMMLIGISRCASPELCPSDQAIMDAVRAYDAGELWAFSQQPENAQALVVQQPIKGISDVLCSDSIPAKVPTVTCRFTVHYWTYDAYHVARLILDDRWKIDVTLDVPRTR